MWRRALIFAVVLAAFFGVLAWLVTPQYGKVTPTTLSYSLERETDGGSALDEEPVPCRRRRDHWSCYVHDTSGSGGGPTYRVVMRDAHCWNAVRTAAATEGRPLPKRATGCVRTVDEPD